MENEILTEKEAFLERLKNEKMKEVVGARIDGLKKRDKNEKRKRELAEITREIIESEYITVEGEELTIGDMIVATATANLINNPRTTFKEINEAQKVIDNDTENNSGGFTVIINTNGQDLGDEV